MNSKFLYRLSAVGMIFIYLTASLASVDWLMSLETEFYSTVFGMVFVQGAALSAMAFAIVFSSFFSRLRHEESLKPVVRYDVGNLLLAFTMLWAYVAFVQFLIIWSGNVSNEVIWFAHRASNGWTALSWCLIVGLFAVPFFCLLFRKVKGTPVLLGSVALLSFAMSVINVFWLVLPSVRPSHLSVTWTDAAAFVGVGFIWFETFLAPSEVGTWLAKTRPTAEVPT